MKRFLKGFFAFISILWVAFGLVISLLLFSSGEKTGGSVFLGVSSLGLILPIKIRKDKREDKIPEPTIEDRLNEMSFRIIKEVKVDRKNTFYVDDINKKFAIKSSKDLKIFNYSDLLGYELIEDGDSIISGKSLATAVGGLTFGPIGALVGSAGKRKNSKVCTSLLVRLFLNDIMDPQFIFTYIQGQTKKSSMIYQAAIDGTRELTGVLRYIENRRDNK